MIFLPGWIYFYFVVILKEQSGLDSPGHLYWICPISSPLGVQFTLLIWDNWIYNHATVRTNVIELQREP